MRKLRIIGLKLLMLLVILVTIYIAGILLLNTIMDYRPKDGPIEIPAAPEAMIDTGKSTYSMITWNIGYGGLGEDADFFYDGGKMVRSSQKDYKRYIGGILKTIASFSGTDFILLQEVDISSARSYHQDQYSDISKRLKAYSGLYAINYRVPFVALPLWNPMGKVVSGLALFSAHPFGKAEMRVFPGNYAWPKKLFMPDRCFIVAFIELPSGKKLYIINTHNSAFDDGSLRAEQLKTMFEHMQGLYQNGNYVIAGGDWNINPPGYENHPFSSGDKPFSVDFSTSIFEEYPDWQVFYDRYYPTNRDVSSPYSTGDCPTTILDFYICSPNIRELEIRTWYDGFQYADHQPVLLKFNLE